MKKIFILLMIIIQNIVFGQNVELTGKQEAVVDVTAEILSPIELIKESDVDFGVVMQGQTKNSITSGKVKIKGEPNKKIKVSARGNIENAFTVKEQYEVLLLKDGSGDITNNQNIPVNQKMSAYLKIILSDGISSLNTDGINYVNIDGKVKASSTQDVGKYYGNIFIRVEYEE